MQQRRVQISDEAPPGSRASRVCTCASIFVIHLWPLVKLRGFRQKHTSKHLPHVAMPWQVTHLLDTSRQHVLFRRRMLPNQNKTKYLTSNFPMVITQNKQHFWQHGAGAFRFSPQTMVHNMLIERRIKPLVDAHLHTSAAHLCKLFVLLFHASHCQQRGSGKEGMCAHWTICYQVSLLLVGFMLILVLSMHR